MSELDKLLNDLRSMKSEASSTVPNTRETWSCIGQGDWAKAGFKSEAEMKQFILDNPYSNI